MNRLQMSMALMLALGACQEAPVDGAAEVASVTEIEPALGPTVAEVMEAAPASAWVTPDPDNLLYMDIATGRIVIMLSPDLAPGHVAQIKTLAREGFYEGLNFYRVVHGFVAQGGDVAETKDVGSAQSPIAAEFEDVFSADMPFTPHGFDDGYADEAGYLNGFPVGRDVEDGSIWLAHCTGAFAFGRNNERDTASTEFYITLQPQRYLDRNLTVVGRVIVGMDLVQAMPRGAFGHGGVIEDETRWTPINKVTVAADLPEAERVPVQIFDTGTDIFRQLIKARSARASEFFHFRHHYLDLCQMPLPVRLGEGGE